MAGPLTEHAGIRKSLDHLIKKDRYFSAHFQPEDVAEITHLHRPVSYEAFARTIVGQQISTKAAASVWAKVHGLVTPFTPKNVLALPDEVLRAAGLSGQKVAYLRGLSEAVASGAFDPAKLNDLSDAEVIAAITALKGFGRWSAEMVLMFALLRTDVFSGGDLGLREGLKRVLKLEERPTEKEAVTLAQRWAGHRTAASLLLWVICHRDAPRVAGKKERSRVPPPARTPKARARVKTAAKRAKKLTKRAKR